MVEAEDRCRRCGHPIAPNAAVYGDNNRRYCSAACARAQLDAEQGTARGTAQRQRGIEAYPLAADRVGPDRGAARTPGRNPRAR
jgi:hypothetical protein